MVKEKEKEKNNDLIDWVNQVEAGFEIPDEFITEQLSLVFTGVAKEWFTEKRKDIGAISWEQCFMALEDRVGTDIWRNKME